MDDGLPQSDLRDEHFSKRSLHETYHLSESAPVRHGGYAEVHGSACGSIVVSRLKLTEMLDRILIAPVQLKNLGRPLYCALCR